MMTDGPVFEWFSEEPLPALLPDPAIVVGGTGLLREFFSIVGTWRSAGNLSIAVPYVGRGIAEKVPALKIIRHESINLCIITRHRLDAEIAQEEMANFPWADMKIYSHARLHAKIYSFSALMGGRACLVGSHNLSQAGMDNNIEAGTLFLSSRRTELYRVVESYQAYIAALIREAELIGEITYHW